MDNWIKELEQTYQNEELTSLAISLQTLLNKQTSLHQRYLNLLAVDHFNGTTFVTNSTNFVNDIPEELDGISDDVDTYQDKTPWAKRSGSDPFTLSCDMYFTTSSKGIEFADASRIETDLSSVIPNIVGNYTTNTPDNNPNGLSYEERLDAIELVTSLMSNPSSTNVTFSGCVLSLTKATFDNLLIPNGTTYQYGRQAILDWNLSRSHLNTAMQKVSGLSITYEEFYYDNFAKLYSGNVLQLSKFAAPVLTIVANAYSDGYLVFTQALGDTTTQTKGGEALQGNLSAHASNFYAKMEIDGNDLYTPKISLPKLETTTVLVHQLTFPTGDGQIFPYLADDFIDTITYNSTECFHIEKLQLGSLNIGSTFTSTTPGPTTITNSTLFYNHDPRITFPFVLDESPINVITSKISHTETKVTIATPSLRIASDQITLLGLRKGHVLHQQKKGITEITNSIRVPSYTNVRPSPRLIAPYTILDSFPCPMPWGEPWPRLVLQYYGARKISEHFTDYPEDVGWGKVRFTDNEAISRMMLDIFVPDSNETEVQIRTNWVQTNQGYYEYCDGRANADFGCLNRVDQPHGVPSYILRTWPSYMDEYRADFFNFLPLGKGVYQFHYHASIELMNFLSAFPGYTPQQAEDYTNADKNHSYIAVALRKPNHSIIKWLGLYAAPMLCAGYVTHHPSIPADGQHHYSDGTEGPTQIDNCGIPNTPWGNSDSPHPMYFETDESSWYISIHILRAITKEKYNARSNHKRNATFPKELGARYNGQATCIRLRYPYVNAEEDFPTAEVSSW